ncbi:MAG: hypothetical protein LQ352_002810 [Teloschistes flavicans]|nr:MAG: hypothetical protein LQ352_002810 [Teloschistes flavicans]
MEYRKAARNGFENYNNPTITSSTVNKEADLVNNNPPLQPLLTAGSTVSKSSSISPAEPQSQHAPSPTTPNPLLRPIRRTPSSSSISANENPLSPILHKRASYSSAQGAAKNVTPPRSPAIRRVSSNLSMNQPTMAPRTSLPAPAEEPERPPVTAASVAKDFFARELQVHQEGSGADHSHDTVVILQDDCYGHRYSRPRTSRASLGTIVERPERIQASVLGLAMAYVRVGGRHAISHAAPHPTKKIGLLASMPFRIQKTNRRVSLTSQAPGSVHGARWMSELKAMCDAAESKLATNGKELSRPQSTEQGIEKSSAEKTKLHEGDLYLCSGSLEALEGAIGGVCEAVDAVFRDGGPRRAFVCIRPPGHHCSADMPSGFCWVNNVHIGIHYATKTHDLTHAAIIDFDLHHGDGSQAITWAHNAKVASMPKNTPQSKRTAIGYFSLHDINSYPCEGGDEDKVRNASLCLENAHGQTIWNVHLQPWKTEKEFWDLYRDRYAVIIAKARSFLRFHTDRLRQAPLHPRPKAAIFLSAGFDASEWESPGMQRHQVNVPMDFYARFTRDVIAIADEEGLGVDGRVISVLEGGYSDRALMSGVLSHLSGLTAAESAKEIPAATNGLGHEMSERLSKLDINSNSRHGSGNAPPNLKEPLDPAWWDLSSLEEIEKLVNPPATAAAPKKSRSAVPTSYTSATQSYIAKVVSPPQNRRSLSGSNTTYPSSIASSPRAPSPPPPPVDWVTAAHELSKLLVPSDRRTWSCKPEELNAEATRARRDRQSNMGPPVEAPAIDGKRMQLRDRKAKPLKNESDEEDEKPVSRANRRKTIADVTTLPQMEDGEVPVSPAAELKKAPKPGARRSSMASTVSSIGGEKPRLASFGSSTAIPPMKDTVLVKKNRAPTSSRTEAAKSRVAKSKPPVPPVLASYGIPPKLNPEPNPQVSTSEPRKMDENVENQSVDQLASGMKKMSIKLNVPSQEEQKIRDAKRTQAAPRGRPKSTAAKTFQVTGSVQKPVKVVNPVERQAAKPLAKPLAKNENEDGRIRVQDLVSPEVIPTVPGPTTSSGSISAPSRNQTLPAPRQESIASLTLPDAAPPSFLAPTAPAIPAISSSASGFDMPAPGIPQAQSAVSMGVQPPPSMLQPTTMPPNPLPAPQPLPPQPSEPAPPAPATPKHTRRDLPVFTSTSSILFSKSSTASGVPSVGQNIEEDQPNAKGSMDFPSGVVDLPGNTIRSHGAHESSRVREAEKDIFDVPVTPEQPRASSGHRP